MAHYRTWDGTGEGEPPFWHGKWANFGLRKQMSRESDGGLPLSSREKPALSAYRLSYREWMCSGNASSGPGNSDERSWQFTMRTVRTRISAQIIDTEGSSSL